MVLMLLFQYYH